MHRLARGIGSTLLIASALLLSGCPDEGIVEGEISVQLIDASEFQAEIAKQAGKVVVVDYWATWCIPCIKNFHHSVDWSHDYAKEGLTVMSVSFDDPDSQEAVLKFLREQHAGIKNFQASGDLEQAMEVFEIDGGALPHFKIFGRDGKLIQKFGGDVDKPTSHRDVERVLRETLGLPAEDS